MKRLNLLICFLGLVLCFSAHSNALKMWCVANPVAPEYKLQDALNFGCQHISCYEIQPGRRCYEPNNLISHASFAMNRLYYSMGFCPDGGVLIDHDPSYGDCHYT